MPIYEYRCEPCDHTFETLVRGASDVARCPRCGNIEVAKQFSVPAAAHAGRSSSASLPICGDSGAPSYGCGRPECGSGSCAFD
jgi:putative FmdB family regulatory protein